jgi:hypothetical protein
MSNNKSSQNDEQGISDAESMQAYLEAQRLLLERKDGYVKFDRIFTKKEEAQHAFGKLTSGELLEYVGNSFYWKRSPGDPVILYAKNTFSEKLRDMGLVELCRIRVPEVWIGVGRFRIDWPDMDDEKDDPTPILISLYLYSTDPAAFKHFVANDEPTAYLASLFFEKENAALLNDLAEERFESIV